MYWNISYKRTLATAPQFKVDKTLAQPHSKIMHTCTLVWYTEQVLLSQFNAVVSAFTHVVFFHLLESIMFDKNATTKNVTVEIFNWPFRFWLVFFVVPNSCIKCMMFLHANCINAVNPRQTKINATVDEFTTPILNSLPSTAFQSICSWLLHWEHFDWKMTFYI